MSISFEATVIVSVAMNIGTLSQGSQYTTVVLGVNCSLIYW